MATTHVVFHLPAGVVGIVFYQVLSDPERLGMYVAPLHTLYLLSMSVSIFGSLADFFIYMYAFVEFRKSACHLFLMCFHSGVLHRHERVDGHVVSGETTGKMSTRHQKGEYSESSKEVAKNDPYDGVTV